MTRNVSRSLLLLLVGLLSLSASAVPEGEEPWTKEDEKFLKTYYYPAEDPNLGKLYPEAAGLMKALRNNMPRAIEVEMPKAEVKGTGEVEEPDAKGATRIPPPERPSLAAPEGWVSVLDRPVVAKEKLAHTYFLAGAYKEAAGVYRSLMDDMPGDPHLTVMLALCERNSGNCEGASKLLEEAAQKDRRLTQWVRWTKEMTKLDSDVKKEEGRQ